MEKNPRADIAIRLVEERARLRYSQADFASKTGLSREGLRLYESGQRGMSAEFLAQAIALGLDVQYVLSGVYSKNMDEVETTVSPGLTPSRHSISQAISGGNTIGIVQGGTVHQVSTQNHVTKTIAEVKPGEQHITDEQAAKLLELVNEVARLEETLKQKPKGHRAIWGALNAHCEVPKYRLIKLDEFPRAKRYLDQWIGRLNSMATAPVKDEDAWRKRRYAYIKINSHDEVSAAAVQKYIATKFKAASLTELSDEDLEKTYRYVASRKRSATLKNRGTV